MRVKKQGVTQSVGLLTEWSCEVKTADGRVFSFNPESWREVLAYNWRRRFYKTVARNLFYDGPKRIFRRV